MNTIVTSQLSPKQRHSRNNQPDATACSSLKQVYHCFQLTAASSIADSAPAGNFCNIIDSSTKAVDASGEHWAIFSSSEAFSYDVTATLPGKRTIYVMEQRSFDIPLYSQARYCWYVSKYARKIEIHFIAYGGGTWNDG